MNFTRAPATQGVGNPELSGGKDTEELGRTELLKEKIILRGRKTEFLRKFTRYQMSKGLDLPSKLLKPKFYILENQLRDLKPEFLWKAYLC